MQKLTLPIAVIALAGVIGLFFLQLAGGNEEIQKMSEDPTTESSSLPKVAFVQIDSLVAKYDRHQALSQEFEKEAQMAELKLKARQSELEKDFEIYSQRAAGLTPEQRREAELDLQRLQAQFQQHTQATQQELMLKQQELSISLKEDLDAVIDRVQKEKSLDLILSQEAGGNVLYAGPSLDITTEVVTYLNQEYNKGETSAEDGEAK